MVYYLQAICYNVTTGIIDIPAVYINYTSGLVMMSRDFLEEYMTLSRKEKEQKQRRQYILDAAKEVFARDGYERASMNEIARLSEFTKRTLYQYFTDKADLYLSVLLFLYEDIKGELEYKDIKYQNGYDLLKQIFHAYYEYYKNHTDTFKIMYDIGKVRTLTDNKKIDAFLKIDFDTTEMFKKIVEIGQNDKSISSHNDALNTAVNLKFLLTALFDKATTTADSYAKHIRKSSDKFINDMLDMILTSVKA